MCVCVCVCVNAHLYSTLYFAPQISHWGTRADVSILYLLSYSLFLFAEEVEAKLIWSLSPPFFPTHTHIYRQKHNHSLIYLSRAHTHTQYYVAVPTAVLLFIVISQILGYISLYAQWQGPLSLSLSLSHTHTLSLSLSHTHTLSLSHTRSLSHFVSLSLTHSAHSPTSFHSLSLSLSLSLSSHQRRGRQHASIF